MKEMRSLLFRIAHRVKGQFDYFSEALRYAWRVIKLKIKMQKNIVEFTFKKVDGSIRHAVGTLKASLLPEIKGTGKSNEGVFVYFDTEANGFRSFRIENLVA